jgi:hypothetical protein
MGGLGDCFGDFWILAHFARAVSELEIRFSRDYRRIILWARVDENRLVVSGRASPRAGGRFMASFISQTRRE